ncbi:MAG: sigma-70 family RNA polymerase sigma factor, partial [Actinobacteria bacterium]|nr:sigma-70 family RNA polymerase sigma factor [Actinomycetota bacterium]
MLQEASRRERIDNDLLRRYHDDGDLLAREQLAERCVPLVRSIARKYSGRGQDMDDLQQAGMLGLVKAIDRFDASTGHRFITFGVPNIQGEIRRHFRDRTWAVHVPRSVQELDAKIQHTRKAVLEETGVEATPDDL